MISIGKILEGPYVVAVDGEVTDKVEIVAPPSGSETVVIRITHPDDSAMITVSGTSVVPEFPLHALLGIASVVGAVIILDRLRMFRGTSVRF